MGIIRQLASWLSTIAFWFAPCGDHRRQNSSPDNIDASCRVNSGARCLVGIFTGKFVRRNILPSIIFLLLPGSSLFTVAPEAELYIYTKITNTIEKKELEYKLDRKAIMTNQVVIR